MIKNRNYWKTENFTEEEEVEFLKELSQNYCRDAWCPGNLAWSSLVACDGNYL
jgi:hypothetical protein